MAETKARSNAVAKAAKGDLTVGSGTNTSAVLAVGSNTQILVADSTASTGLKWATVSGGKILQVAQGSTTAAASNTTTTLADTGITATITPTLATSTILLMLTMDLGYVTSGLNRGANIAFFRGVTNIKSIASAMWRAGSLEDGSVAMNWIDSPATTSATTYKVQFALASSTGTAYINANGAVSTLTLIEIGA